MVDVYDKRQAAAARAMADGAMPAGRPTAPLNAAFCAFDYLPSKLDRQRSFLMDDYLSSGRMARAQSESSRRDTSCARQSEERSETSRDPTASTRRGFTNTADSS